MAEEKFSWLRAIGEARHSAADAAAPGLATLRSLLRDHPMQGFELEMLGRFLRDQDAGQSAGYPVLRVAIVSGYTTEPLANAVRVALLAEGFRADVYEAPFAAYRQEILSPASGLYAFDPELVLVAPAAGDIQGMPTGPMGREDVESALHAEVEQWQALWGELGKHCAAPVLQHTFELPATSLVGAAERTSPWSPSRFTGALNDELVTAAAGRVHWVDVDRLAARVGRSNWEDPRLRYHGKFAFSARCLPDYAAVLGGALRSALGRASKALIVDLDNTLWGGVIGDDGLDGIRLGPDSPEGEAYQAFCSYIGDLGRRGVILGICSKNEMANVREVFELHRHMPLQLGDFVAVRCNWEDKASNLSDIARELNIDPSALVFVDDNPAECEQVRQALPDVQVIQMAGDPANFVRLLDSRYRFDSQVLSSEDIRRAESYRARSRAAELEATSSNLETYLVSLEMRGGIWQARSEDLSRLAQMEAKTNQFNLTTRRWSAEQIDTFMQADDHTVLCFRMTDRFTDHGFVGSMVVRWTASEARILSWLLSCRVFSRTCEAFMLAGLLELARQRGVRSLVGEYIPTPKNKVVAGLFGRLGFDEGEEDGEFVLDVAQAGNPETYIAEDKDG